MIAEVQGQVNEGDISHPTINRDRRSPSGGRSMVYVDSVTDEQLSIAEFGIGFKHRASCGSTIHCIRRIWGKMDLCRRLKEDIRRYYVENIKTNVLYMRKGIWNSTL
jgi:hypothetical protein